jgi:hyaluronan synthase
MIHFFYQLFSTYHTGTIYLFEMFVIFAWLIFFPRVFVAKLYKPIISNKRFRVSVIVPTFKESPEDFEKCLSSLKHSLEYNGCPYEIIVNVDGINKGQENDEVRIARRYADTVLTHNSRNKRVGLIQAIRQSKYDIIVTSDSDTFYEEITINELLKPFEDEKVGGVTSYQRIYKPKTLIQRCADWFENARIKSSLPAMSYFNSVGCLPGRCIAYRKQIIVKHEDEFVNEHFYGTLCITGDDRAITNFILKDGYKSIFQTTARVTTIAPEGLLQWSKQQLRWGRSSQRYTLFSLNWLWKFPMTFFVYITDFLLTLFLMVILAQCVLDVFIGNTGVPLLLALTLAFLGCCITVILKQFPHLKENKKDILLIPSFALLMTYMQIIRFYGLLTLKKANKWGTR